MKIIHSKVPSPPGTWRQLILLAATLGLTLAAVLSPNAGAQVVRPGMRAGARILLIRVESVFGSVRYSRNGRFRRLTRDSRLTQGDTIVVQVGSTCKLQFRHPGSNAILSAVILTGFTEMKVSQAYEQNQQTRTVLLLPQGVIRAGVVRTAVPPSFRVRTPRIVVAVRGTEIREIEASNDLGDIVRMGVVGEIEVSDNVPLLRSVRAGQGTRKRTETDRRGGRLLRAIENAILTHRVTLSGPHRRGLIVDLDRHSGFDLYEFGSSVFFKSEGNPSRDRYINSGRVPRLLRAPTQPRPLPPGPGKPLTPGN